MPYTVSLKQKKVFIFYFILFILLIIYFILFYFIFIFRLDESIFDSFLYHQGGCEMIVRRSEEPKIIDEEEKEENKKTEDGDVIGELVLETMLCERIRYILEFMEINGSEQIGLGFNFF